MTRRILLALLALTTAILAGAVIPLALQAMAHERDSFMTSAEATAHSIAIIAEDKIADHQSDPALRTAVRIATRQGDELVLLNAQHKPVVGVGAPRDTWQHVVESASQTGSQASELTRDRAVVAEPVWNDGRVIGSPIGMVILERPIGPLDDAITNLWLYLALLGGGALCAAALIAITFARWVNRPLARMDSAARRLADGNLTVRAGTGSGPPELRRLAASFNMMAGRLETLVHGHRAMLADVSHQLRTPLAALRLRIDLLKVDSPPAVADELDGAQEEIARLSRLVDGLLEIARAESVTEQVVTVNLRPAVAERVTAWQPVADGHGVKLVTDFHGRNGAQEVPRVALGAGHLEQILDNLLANAIDVLRDDGQVTVTVSGADGGATLTVADNGPGMSPAERARAFLRFASGNKNGGTGLGLAIVHRLVTSNGGTARLADTPGGGLTVILDFPGVTLYEGTNQAT
ncbi:MAG: HAMP domain-containing histidine kinase [Streptosporangiales bacterium]|nr:HAMP domain-containing histidine kinase [Streptosporangiales bacterium]